MECAHVAELLPWLLNDTLDAAEAESVREHLATCPSCAAELEETRTIGALAAGHLPAGALVEYEFGTPPPASLCRLVESHLGVCNACADELSLVRQSHRGSGASLVEPLLKQAAPAGRRAGERPTPSAPARLARIGAAPVAGGGWRYGTWAATLIAAVALGGWVHTWQRAESERAAWRERERGRTAQAVPAGPAASPTPAAPVAANGAGDASFTRDQARAEIARLRRRLERAAAPQINPLVVELLPRLADALRRAPPGDAGLNALELPRDAPYVTLVLVANKAMSREPHEVEIHSRDGAVAWSARGLRAQASGDFTLRLPVGLLPSGRFQVRVLRADDASEGRRLVAVYDVDNRAPRH